MILTCYLLAGLLVLFLICADQTNAWGIVTNCRSANIAAGFIVVLGWPLIVTVEVLSLIYELRRLKQ